MTGIVSVGPWNMYMRRSTRHPGSLTPPIRCALRAGTGRVQEIFSYETT